MSVVRRDFALFEMWELSFVYDLKKCHFSKSSGGSIQGGNKLNLFGHTLGHG
jgi:hypothetical protein